MFFFFWFPGSKGQIALVSFSILVLVQLGLVIGLLVLGIKGKEYMGTQTSVGVPYYAGAILVAAVVSFDTLRWPYLIFSKIFTYLAIFTSPIQKCSQLQNSAFRVSHIMPESREYCQRGSNLSLTFFLFFFLIDEGRREAPNTTTISGPSLARQWNAI